MNQATWVQTVPEPVHPGTLDVGAWSSVTVPETCIVTLSEDVCVTQAVVTVQIKVQFISAAVKEKHECAFKRVGVATLN